jgi:hypothetical protein
LAKGWEEPKTFFDFINLGFKMKQKKTIG